MPNEFYTYLGVPNPFEVTVDPQSREAADIVANLLGNPETTLSEQLGTPVVVVDNYATWDSNVFPMPALGRYSVKAGDSKPVLVSDVVDWFNTYNPEALRIALNERGIGTLGPNPLPLPFGYNFAYQSAYMTDPLALDPGPIPNNILGYIAGLEKRKKAAAAKAGKK